MRTSAAILVIGGLIAAAAAAHSEPAPEPRLHGLNVIQAAGYPFGGDAARTALADAKRLGANAIAVIPFLWQPDPASPDLVRGTDMSDAELRAAIRDAHALGLAVLVKPHVWVPGRWAGAVVMKSEAAWQDWFGNYQRELEHLATIAQEEQAETLVIGTELTETSQQPAWREMIRRVRSIYSGRLLYVAHNIEEAENVPFWEQLDAIGVSLYPPLGPDQARDARLAVMRSTAERLDALAAKTGKPVIVAEIGLRSATGAAERPWESPEERTGAPAPGLQADVLADWLRILARPAVQGVLIWRWFTNPDAGGIDDTDFTVQGKPAQRVLMCLWKIEC